MAEQCRVIIHKDGSWETNHPVSGVTLDEAWGVLTAHNPGYAELAYFDLDVADLPPEFAACETCPEQHSTVDQWVIDRQRLVIDPSLPNLPKVLRHVVQRREAEANGRADVQALARLDQAIQRGIAGHALTIADRAAVVDDLEAVLAQAGDPTAPSQPERFSAMVADLTPALSAATSLDQVKAAFGEALRGLNEIYGAGQS